MIIAKQMILVLSTLALRALALSPADLQIKLHEGLFNHGTDAKSKVVFGSVLTIPQVTQWTGAEGNGKMYDLACKAFQGMLDERERAKAAYSSNKIMSTPAVVTVVVAGDQVSISSSMKGGGIMYKPIQPRVPQWVNPKGKQQYWSFNQQGLCPSAIIMGLEQCAKEIPTTDLVGHVNGGSCGEVMAAWALCDVVGDNQADQWLKGAKVIAVTRDKDANCVIKDPCAADSLGQWQAKGCATFNQHFQWNTIQGRVARVDTGDVKVTAAHYAQYEIGRVPVRRSRL